MPTTRYKKSELKRLIGRRISDDQLADVIALIKPNLESVEGESITVEHTADRPDLFGVEGLARSVKNYLGMKKGLSKYTVFKPKFGVKMSAVPVRPYVSAAVVRKVRMDGGFFDSMIDIQEMLNDSVGRKRGRAAIGIHDLGKIKGQISYVGVPRGEEMVPLGGSEKMALGEVLEKVDKGVEFGGIVKAAKLWPVFKDSKGVFSFPPIINSDRTKVTEETKDFFVEVTGTDKQAVTQVMGILVSNFAERKFSIEGVKLIHERKTETTPVLSESVSEINTKMVNDVLGLDLSARQIIDLLKRMGYDALGSGDKIEVIVPAFRSDILHPVDVVEDVAIAHGYNNFKPVLPNLSTVGSPLEIERLCGKASMSLMGFGFQEVIGSALSNRRDQFGRMLLPEARFVEIENPSSREYDIVRPRLVPGLLKFLSSNKHHEYPQNVFEAGDVVLPDRSADVLFRNERRVAGAICHSKAGFSELKSVVDGVMGDLGTGYSTRTCNMEMYIPGRAVDMYLEKKYVGTFGELHPQVVENWGMGMPTAVFEIITEKFL